MDDKLTFTVLNTRDNIYHTCQYLNESWYGMENVCMDIDDKDFKWYTIRKLKQMMLVEIEGKWGGFEWIPCD